MKRACIFAVTCLLLLQPASALAQRRRAATQRRPRTVTKTTQVNATDARTDGAQRVADQIKILTRFLYLLGGVAKGIEAADDAARRGDVSPDILARTRQSKASVNSSIQNVRDGLDKLEIDFRTTPELQRYYTSLAGVAEGAATAEDQAVANHYDQAGRTLLAVVNKLTDALLEMR